MTTKEFKKELATMDLGGDPWGTTLECHFMIAHILYDREAAIPKHWGYKPSPIAEKQADTDSYWFDVLNDETDENLVHFGNLLARYAQVLKRNDRDY